MNCAEGVTMTRTARVPQARHAVGAIVLTAMLSLDAGRDLSRQDAEFVDVPITDEHFDRGQHFLTVAPSFVIMSPLAQQMIEQIDGFPIRIVSHDPTPRTTPPTSGPIVAVRWRDVIGGWSLDQG